MMARSVSNTARSLDLTGSTVDDAPWAVPLNMPPIQRCKMAHQRAHEELGTQCGPDRAEEAQADRLAAMRLISLQDLARAAARGGTPRQIATRLHVTLDTLKTRERHMHPAERASVTRQIRKIAVAS